MDLAEEVERIKWWHTIDLGNGIVTPGLDDSPKKLQRLEMPEDLTGMSVLDVGAWDGFFSFEAERRGAARVLALDSVAWQNGGKKGFELARKQLNSKVEDVNMEVLDISPQALGEFDLVLFLGVLYHMKHPLLALEGVSSVTKTQLILETHVDLVHLRRPAMAFYPDAELNNDSSNWWGPNTAAVEAMLRTVGFVKVERVSQYRSPVKGLGAALHHYITKRDPFFASLQQNRMVFHAFK